MLNIGFITYPNYAFVTNDSVKTSKSINNERPLRENDVITLNYTIYSDLNYHNKTFGKYYMGSYLSQTVKELYFNVKPLPDWFWQELIGSNVNDTVVFTKSSQWAADNLHPVDPVYGTYLIFDVTIVDMINLEKSENNLVESIFDFVTYITLLMGSIIIVILGRKYIIKKREKKY